MKFISIILFFTISINAFAQRVSTEVVTIDMQIPNNNSIKVEPGLDNKVKNGLSFRTRKAVAIKLKNCNPFKYKYSISATPISFFQGTNPFDTLNNKFNIGNLPLSESFAATKNSDISNQAKDDSSKIGSLANKSKNKNANLIPIDGKVTMRDTSNTYSGIGLYNKIVLELISDSLTNNNSNGKLSDQTLFAIFSIAKNKALSTVLYNFVKLDTAGVMHKLFLLWQKTRSEYENLLYYEIKISSEDYLITDSFNLTMNTFAINYDKIIDEYKNLYEYFYFGIDTSGMGDNQKAELDTLKKWLPRTISNLKTGRNYLRGIQLDYYTLPIDMNGPNIDAIEVNIKRNFIKNQGDGDKYTYKIWINGGLKIDASAGLFLTTLVDQQFNTKDTIDSNRKSGYKTILAKRTGNLAFGFGSMLDLSLRTGASWLRPSVNFGISFTTNSTIQKFQLLSGIGFIIGKEQRVILHMGAAFGTVTVLQSGFKADGVTPYNLGTSGTVPTDEKFDVGYFFGLSYNLAKSKVQQGNISQ